MKIRVHRTHELNFEKRILFGYNFEVRKKSCIRGISGKDCFDYFPQPLYHCG
jgi:hypothetical protein